MLIGRYQSPGSALRCAAKYTVSQRQPGAAHAEGDDVSDGWLCKSNANNDTANRFAPTLARRDAAMAVR